MDGEVGFSELDPEVFIFPDESSESVRLHSKILWQTNLDIKLEPKSYNLLFIDMQPAATHKIQEHDSDESNDFSSASFFPEFIHRQDAKRSTQAPKAIPFAAKLEKLSFELITKLEILSPSRLKSYQLRKQLKNYQFERHQKRSQSENLSMFGLREDEILRDQNTLLLTLTSIMKEFRSSKNQRFFIITKKNERVFNFYHKEKEGKIDSIVEIAGFSEFISPILDKEGIPFERIPNPEYEKILVKNQAISLFWGKLINKILQNQKFFRSFHIVTNFPFVNGFESLPIETFNSSETKKQFSHIANEKKNILDESVFQTFRIKLQGFWTVENLKELDVHLTQSFGEQKFEVKIEIHHCTKEHNDQIL